MSTRVPMGRPLHEHLAARGAGAVLSVLLFALTTPPALAAAATLEGVLAEPDGSGARIQVVLSGPVHYVVTARAESVVITLDGVVSRAMTHHLVVGPITGILIRPTQRAGLRRLDVVVTTRMRVRVVETRPGERLLLVRLAAADCQ